MRMRSTAWAVGALAMLILGAVATPWARAGGGPPRWYQAHVDVRVPIDGELAPAVRFVIDTPGRVTALYATLSEPARYGRTDFAVGSVWVNGPGGQVLDDVFDVRAVLAPDVLHRLATFGPPTTSDVWVGRGDVVTALWDDDGTTPPDWPAATWVLEVQE